MTLQIIRWMLVVISIGIVAVSHMIVTTVQQRRDGNSQWVLCRSFGALRLYGLMLLINFLANAIIGHSNVYALAGFGVANLYLFYTLAAFWMLLHRGRRLP